MAEGTAAYRDFADHKHASGQWRSRDAIASSGLVRAVASYCSYKRQGVTELAQKIRGAAGPIIDLGAGQGAYARWCASISGTTVIAIDLSFEALRRAGSFREYRILRVCADAHHLPLKAECAVALYSVDTLGHVAHLPQVFDEILRVVRPGAPLFLHSECADYRTRWPDRMLEKRLGYDVLARLDGHISLLPGAVLRSLVTSRFIVTRIWSPGGITGWLTGYPEKYFLAFRAARLWPLVLLTALFARIKQLPVLGLALRILNATLNHGELALGIEGGGSLFMVLQKPASSPPIPACVDRGRP